MPALTSAMLGEAPPIANGLAGHWSILENFYMSADSMPIPFSGSQRPHDASTRSVFPVHKRVSALLGTALVIIGCTFGQISAAAEMDEFTEDRVTPELSLNDMHGNPHTLADYRGKVVLVNFWAGWCHPCLQEIPELISLAQKLDQKPFVILAVNVGEEREKFGGFVRRMDEHMVILMDTESEAFERWKGIGLPSTFVVDPAGSIRYEAYGPVDWDRQDVVAALTTLMEEKAGKGPVKAD